MVFKRTVQTLVYLPYFLSWVILGGILIDVLSVKGGIVNQFLGLFGIGEIFFLGDGFWFRVTLIVTDIWKEFGFSAIVYLAALAGSILPCTKRRSSTARTAGSRRFTSRSRRSFPS